MSALPKVEETASYTHCQHIDYMISFSHLSQQLCPSVLRQCHVVVLALIVTVVLVCVLMLVDLAEQRTGRVEVVFEAMLYKKIRLRCCDCEDSHYLWLQH